MLRIDRLRFSIGEQIILDDISAKFEPGKMHGIIGPNGAGKSTLLKNICRIWEPQTGTVFVDGQDYRRISRKALSTMITMVPQNATIAFPISVYDVVSMGRHPHLGRFQSLTTRDRNIIEKALSVTQTYELKDRNMNELSGGECQLSIMARALATEASFMLLDEPTSDLDVKHSLAIMGLLCDLRQEGKTILVNIHDLNMAKRYCDTISIIHQGELFFVGTPSEAFSEANIQQVFGVNMSEVQDDSRSFLYFYP
ncbi:MAG: ABC transporter ATP-binding protein [Deltaproteobacteria bacterium]|jgi:iron complex transport system ATP-binding protein